MDSVNRRTLRSTGTWNSGSSSTRPRPTPSVARPPLSWSSVATTWATCTGWYVGSTKTATPRRIRIVSAAAYVRTVSESKDVIPSTVLFVTHRSWNPSASARWATLRTTASGIGSGDRCGSDIPSSMWSLMVTAE